MIGLSLLLGACAQSTISDADVTAVHQAILSSHFEHDDWGQHGESLLILSDQLAVPEDDRRVPLQDPSRTVCLAQHYPPPDAIADYETKALRSRPLQGRFDLPIEYRFLKSGRWRQILTEEGGWQGYQWTFPGARRFVQLSDVGFDSTGTMAVVYLADYPETGLLYVLRKNGNEWQIVDGCMLWVS